MVRFEYPYFQGQVELSDERRRHIVKTHPELLPEHLDLIALTLADPDRIRRSVRFSSGYLFGRWCDDLLGGKHVVVVVITESAPLARYWIVTAYVARRLAEGETLWRRS
jgi:hypothetical protein